MRPLWLWLRSSWWVTPLMLAALSAGLLRTGAWRWDWAWMLSTVAGSTLLASPVLAAAAALVTLRSYPPVLAELATTTRRGDAVLVQAGLVVWLQALVGYGTCLGAGALGCWRYEADQRGLVLPWQLLTAPAALLAAVVLGLLVGRLVRSAWAVPALAVGLFLAHRPFFWTPLPELVTLKMATGSMANAGLRTIPEHLMATTAVNLLLAAGLGVLLQWLSRPAGARPWRWLVVTGVCLAVLLVVMGWGWDETYQPIPA